MTPDTSRCAEAPARVLAMAVAANGRIDAQELDTLEALRAFERLGVERERFVELARECLHEDGASLGWRAELLLSEIDEPGDRLLLCRLAAAAITADGQVSRDERMVYERMLARWRVDPSQVAREIRDDAARLAQPQGQP